MTAEPVPARPEPAWARERLEGYFRVAAFVVLLLLAAIATFRAYFSLESAILTWFRPQWVPVAQAGFSVVMVAATLVLLRSWVIARAR